MWTTLIPIIIQYGIPAAEKIWQMMTSTVEVTQADWDALKKMTEQTPDTQIRAALGRAGIPLTDPRAISLLALIS